MNRVFISLALIILSIILIASGMILIGMYLFIAAFGYFQFTLLTWGQVPESKPKVVPHHVTAEEFYKGYYNRKPEIRAKRVAERRRQKQLERQRQYCLARKYGGGFGVAASTSSSSDASDNSDSYFESIINLTTGKLMDLDDHAYVNPATGEMMIGGRMGVDTSGNPFGANNHFYEVEMFDSADMFDDNCNSLIDDMHCFVDDDFCHTD